MYLCISQALQTCLSQCHSASPPSREVMCQHRMRQAAMLGEDPVQLGGWAVCTGLNGEKKVYIAVHHLIIVLTFVVLKHGTTQ